MDAPAITAVETPSETRVAQGYMSAEEFLAFLDGKAIDHNLESITWLTLVLVLLGGLAMNMTPCVLPLVPITLMVIGKSVSRGLLYGLGIALAYGVLGIAAGIGGVAFGAIQGSLWFNLAIAIIFVVLALSQFEVFALDLSGFRARSYNRGAVFLPLLLGAMNAVLAGACVAPMLISVLVLTSSQVAKGNMLATLMPFVFGVGMALPWPLAGAGMKVLPTPGRWMKWINYGFGVLLLVFAAYYGWLAKVASEDAAESQQVELKNLANIIAESKRPVLVDCWASWCKNCQAMDAELKQPKVKEALEKYTFIKVRAEDINQLRAIKGFESIIGLPAFVIFDK